MATSVIWWIRRDLRLEDNPALVAAVESGAHLLPVFILDPVLLNHPAPNRQGFLFAGLNALDADLRARGSRLIIRQGQPLAELQRLAGECSVRAIFACEDYSPYARRRDAAVAAALPLHLTGGVTVHPPQAVLKPDGSPYLVFTPFSKLWKNLPLSAQRGPALLRYLPACPDVASLAIPTGQPSAAFPAGEAAAGQRLQAFFSGPIDRYADDRNRLDLDGTSALSPYLRFGMLSPRQAAAAARSAAQNAPTAAVRAGAETWLNELIWRDFYTGILYHFPEVLKTAFHPALRSIAWRSAPSDLVAWQQGRTGYPIIDAAMRQLLATGWMPNRARMLTASFLVKNLLINWQEGERWFMRHLVDGDPAANNGGWQWTAGVGTDAAPYFRIFNPTLQSLKFDPQGVYLRRWLPELAHLPNQWIHTPWLMPPDELSASGYPLPIVDLAQTNERTLAAYHRSKVGD